MKTSPNILGKISASFGLALVLMAVVWWSVAAQAADKNHHSRHPLHMNQIKTQAQAEALKPGDSIAMVCSMCKNVVVHEVAQDNSHVKMMTIGHRHTCADCGGNVEVVGAGQGKGKNDEVKHVCSKCGADAMFVCATKPGSGAGMHHETGKHREAGKHHERH